MRPEMLRTYDKEDYLLSLNERERMLYGVVKLFLAALGMRCFYKNIDPLGLTEEDMHRFFPVFAQDIGCPLKKRELLGGKCTAVSVYLDQNWLNESVRRPVPLYPIQVYFAAQERVDNHPLLRKMVVSVDNIIHEITTKRTSAV
jgi:hypothetical protein